LSHNVKKGRKLNRNIGQRKALKKSLVRALVLNGKIETTISKAKYIKPFAERLVSIAKKKNLASFRLLVSRTGSKDISKKLLNEIAPRFKDINGGYTRIQRIGVRSGDSAQTAKIEWVFKKAEEETQKAKDKKTRKVSVKEEIVSEKKGKKAKSDVVKKTKDK